jgi:hypothetical protein
MSSWSALATAAALVWLGMVLAISFLETPLKFRAPEVTVKIGLGIGRLVFRALNVVELVLAALVMIGVLADLPTTRILVDAMVAVVVLLVQVGLVRPVLTRRSDRVLAGEDVPRSMGHYWYVGLELVKVVALASTGIFLLAA